MALSHPETNELTQRIIGCAIEVHRHLGPGLLESNYEECLDWELCDSGLSTLRQKPIAIEYKSHITRGAYRPDLIVEKQIIVEVKSVEAVLPIHRAQLLTYLKVTGLKVGLLFNFNTIVLTEGITRISL